MKSLKITLILAAFCLTLGNTSTKKNTELKFDKEQVEAYKELKKNVDLLAEVRKSNKKPGHHQSF